MKKTIHSQMAKVIHQQIVEMRKQAGYTQRDLAKKLGREHSFVARIEQGERRVDLVEFYLICQACETPPRKSMLDLIQKFSKIE